MKSKFAFPDRTPSNALMYSSYTVLPVVGIVWHVAVYLLLLNFFDSVICQPPFSRVQTFI